MSMVAPSSSRTGRRGVPVAGPVRGLATVRGAGPLDLETFGAGAGAATAFGAGAGLTGTFLAAGAFAAGLAALTAFAGAGFLAGLRGFLAGAAFFETGFLARTFLAGLAGAFFTGFGAGFFGADFFGAGFFAGTGLLFGFPADFGLEAMGFFAGLEAAGFFAGLAAFLAAGLDFFAGMVFAG
jgi:hypothetical protein